MRVPFLTSIAVYWNCYIQLLSLKVWVKKKGPTFKNWPLVKNLHFLTYRHETWGKSLAREVIIFTKFHEDWAKNVDFLQMVYFWMCLVFYSPDFIRHLIKGNLLYLPLKLTLCILWLPFCGFFALWCRSKSMMDSL